MLSKVKFHYQTTKKVLHFNDVVPFLLYSYKLTDNEIDALRNSISDEVMGRQGWATD